jgi:tryptophanyl-tRNA synthetase
MKAPLVSGIQPTGRLHIGNYLGALKNFVDLQNLGRYDCHFVIVDLHALTEHIAQKEQRRNILELAADFLAAGIDPKKSVFFQQSQVPAHAELCWVLSSLTPMGELNRMTQFKDKSDRHGANVGLFTYPVLMASDILLYDPKVVPVGEDQLQHLELARTLARKFNERYGRTFVEPKPLLTEAPRVMNLLNPAKKMSKSDPNGCVFLDDEPNVVANKVRRAVTDSGSEIIFDPVGKPALANLLRIYAAVGSTTVKRLESKYRGVGYGTFKRELADVVVDHLTPIREKKKKLMRDPAKLRRIIDRGSKQANKIADAKFLEVRKRLGLSF